MNKFELHYSKVEADKLIQQIRLHKAYGNIIDKEWYAALLIHMNSRDISKKQREELDEVLSKTSEEIKHKLADESQKEQSRNDEELNLSEKINTRYIFKAGKNLKAIVLITIAAIVLSGLIMLNQDQSDPLKFLYLAIGVVLIANIFVLIQIYNAGSNLEKACKKGL